ncbi:hypothetical protein ACLEXY_02755 [Enterobacter ludwigii]|uniref:hypothetical protein n=1 Tax=Enterobacter ludwigii TaxID=299767 RepID=UPI0005CFDF32|nr:hypothetical protein [Enterobacter ludwigii]OPB23654.1 hypothetical protein BFW94_12605 [Enterobacter ludwigii]HDT4040791.1 hypothetical protein [Enterobacter kobei]HED2269630.1 hypothetical protein [Citrobacter freundii]
MTTVVYDRLTRAVTSDSRWSCDLDAFDPGYAGHILYVDDTGFGKLAIREDSVMVLAGNGILIELWKKWLTREVLSFEEDTPPLSIPGQMPFSIYLIEISTNKVLFDEGHKHTIFDTEKNEVVAAFSGSGGPHAANNWMTSLCARTAIDFAKLQDHYTGGTVRYVDFSSGKCDLESELTTIQEVVNLMLERGFIMDTKKPTAAPVSISAQEVAHVRQLLANGSIMPSAPVGKGAADWSDESKARFFKAIEHIRDSEANRKAKA